MNKRQYKKAFKKEYGYNPPTMKTVFKWVGVMGTILNNFENAVLQVLEDGVEVIKKLKKQIKDMPDENFKKSLNELTPNQKRLVYKWRSEEDD